MIDENHPATIKNILEYSQSIGFIWVKSGMSYSISLVIQEQRVIFVMGKHYESEIISVYINDILFANEPAIDEDIDPRYTIKQFSELIKSKLKFGS